MRLFLSICILFTLFSCRDEAVRVRPKNTLPSDSMAIVLAEVHIINAGNQHRDVRKKKLQAYAFKEYQTLFDSLRISEKRFQESFDWWNDDPEDIRGILDETLNILSARLEESKTNQKLKKEVDTEETAEQGPPNRSR